MSVVLPRICVEYGFCLIITTTINNEEMLAVMRVRCPRVGPLWSPAVGFFSIWFLIFFLLCWRMINKNKSTNEALKIRGRHPFAIITYPCINIHKQKYLFIILTNTCDTVLVMKVLLCMKLSVFCLSSCEKISRGYKKYYCFKIPSLYNNS